MFRLTSNLCKEKLDLQMIKAELDKDKVRKYFSG